MCMFLPMDRDKILALERDVWSSSYDGFRLAAVGVWIAVRTAYIEGYDNNASRIGLFKLLLCIFAKK